MFLQSIETTNLPLVGTCVSNAGMLASKATSGEAVGSRVMILISDGKNHDSKIKEAANAAKKQV
ncbi:MAG: VWA domain-containing protein [Endomicrobium sp.]|nr:VWA domain-containing protein [Endomicrobium sp.]